METQAQIWGITVHVITDHLLASFQTRVMAGWLTAELSKEGHQVALLSNMTEEQRAVFIQRFRDGKAKVLVTTSVSSVRGKSITSIV